MRMQGNGRVAKTTPSSAAGCAGAIALLAGGCTATTEERNESASNAVSAEPTGSDAVRLIDVPSSPPVVLRWKGALDGARSTSSLDFEIENTTGEPIDVEIKVSSHAGKRAEGAGKSVRVAGHATAAESIRVSDLGVQTVGMSAQTSLVATYRGPDGVNRVAPLEAVWVEHDSGFFTARVRSTTYEAIANGASGRRGFGRKRPAQARVLDRSGRTSALDVAGSELVGAPRVVAQPDTFPNPSASVADPVSAENELTDKGGTYKVCFKLGYSYIDIAYGEDYLYGNESGYYGHEAAQFMYGLIADPAGNALYGSYLDRSGCLSATFANGSYVGWVTTSIYDPSVTVRIDVTADNTKTFYWYGQDFNISGSGGTITLGEGFGYDTVTSAATAAANTVVRTRGGYGNGTNVNLYVNQSCADPMYPHDPCAMVSNVYLGPNYDGTWLGWYKSVIGHELGHQSMSGLFGTPNFSYNTDSDQPSCRCDHVTVLSNKHCLQSRDPIGTAQVEGWGHFFAAYSTNNPAHAQCMFGYYKQFREDDGTVWYPPVLKSCYAETKWLNNHCATNSANKGVEYDWMNFYWRLMAKDGYSFADFARVYKKACGEDVCRGQDVTWSMLQMSAVGAFGSGNPKAIAWATQGANFGVNH